MAGSDENYCLDLEVFKGLRHRSVGEKPLTLLNSSF